MSDPNWAPPTGPDAPVPSPPSGPDAPLQLPPMASPPMIPGAAPLSPAGQPQPHLVYAQQPHAYPAADPQQNWGMALPGVSYAVLVPRPPRPAVVGTAITLAFVGVGLALVYQAANSVYQWTNRGRVADALTTRAPGIDAKNLADASTTLGLVIGGVLWLIVAAGVVVCAILARRKKNAARIVLAVSMGVMGLYQLCGVAGSAYLSSLGSQSTSSAFGFSVASAEIPWWAVTAQGLLAVIALIVFVLLIVPPANRYFAAGAGRRFAPEV